VQYWPVVFFLKKKLFFAKMDYMPIMKDLKPKRSEIRSKTINLRLVRPSRMNPKVHKAGLKKKFK